MKTRTGFVSNSSSSSFIISAPAKEKPSASVRIEIENFVEDTIKTQEELEQYMIDQYGDDWNKDDYSKKIGSKMLNQIKRGNIVYVCSASSEGDSAMGQYLANNGLGELTDMNFLVISDDGGY